MKHRIKRFKKFFTVVTDVIDTVTFFVVHRGEKKHLVVHIVPHGI